MKCIWNLAFGNWDKHYKLLITKRKMPNTKNERKDEKQMKKQNQKGITLIALIITIIVMLILVGVTISVALNGGLFSKAEEAGSKTKISQIQEALTLKKAEKVADNNGKEPTDYEITIDNLDMPEALKKEYGNKLKISKNGYLYYDASVVTDKEEQNQLKSMGIEEYVETNVGDSTDGETSEEDSDVKYYYTDYVEVRGIGHKGIFVVKELENDYREAIFYYSNEQECSYMDFSGIFRQSTATKDIVRGNLEIKEGTVLYSDGTVFIIENSIYLSDGPSEFYYEFKLTKLNDAIKNIIETAK